MVLLEGASHKIDLKQAHLGTYGQQHWALFRSVTHIQREKHVKGEGELSVIITCSLQYLCVQTIFSPAYPVMVPQHLVAHTTDQILAQ